VTTPVRLSLFAVLLAAVFAGAAVVGAAVNPLRSDERDHATDHGSDTESSAATPPGLAVAQDGYRLALKRTTYQHSARPQRVAFQIVDDRGHPIRNYDVAHEKKMHFIVVRRDFAGFQHLHRGCATTAHGRSA